MAQDMQPETEATGQGTPTPLRAVRLACLECCDGSASEVRQCEATSCPLWTFRFGRRPSAEDKAAVVAAEKPVYPIERRLTGTSGLKAVRRRCLDCSGGTDAAVRSCTVSACPLFEFRLGKNPNIVRSPERKEADARRLALLRTPALSPRPAGNAEKTGAQVLEGEYGPPDKRRAELASPSGLRRAARSVSLSEGNQCGCKSCLVAQLREEVDQRQWTWTAMADGALPQARRRRASQISRKIEFGMDQEIAETGISEAGFRLLTTAEQRKRLNRHLAPLGMHKGEQIKARDIRRFWQRRRLG